MCGTLVRICASTSMKPRGFTATPAFCAPIARPLGARPTASSTRSYGCGPCGAFSPSNVTCTASLRASIAVVFVFSMMRSKRGLLTFSQTRTRSRSAPGIRPSSISTTSSRAPSVEYTVPISRPMMPPPTISIRFGIAASARAPVESTMRGSCGANGRRIACEPAAMIAWRKRTVVVLPVVSLPSPVVAATASVCASTKLPTPRTTRTLRDLAMPATPPESLPTTLSRQARNFARSNVGAPKSTPCAASARASSVTAATCSSAFDGMQPTLRQTPPSAA